METYDTRTAIEADEDREEPATPGYVVDPDAVAGALVERLLAGRALRLR